MPIHHVLPFLHLYMLLILYSVTDSYDLLAQHAPLEYCTKMVTVLECCIFLHCIPIHYFETESTRDRVNQSYDRHITRVMTEHIAIVTTDHITRVMTDHITRVMTDNINIVMTDHTTNVTTIAMTRIMRDATTRVMAVTMIIMIDVIVSILLINHIIMDIKEKMYNNPMVIHIVDNVTTVIMMEAPTIVVHTVIPSLYCRSEGGF